MSVLNKATQIFIYIQYIFIYKFLNEQRNQNVFFFWEYGIQKVVNNGKSEDKDS